MDKVLKRFGSGLRIRTPGPERVGLGGGPRSLSPSALVLFAVASEPRCSLNISLPGNAVHESDFVEVECIIEYKGSGWRPAVNCTPEVPIQLVGDQVSYIGVMAAADIRDWTVISCEIRFVQTETEWVSPQVESVPDAPSYRYTWHSSSIRVFNTTGRD